MSLSLFEVLSEKLPSLTLKREELLSHHTSFRIGGPAEVMAFPHTVGELSDLLRTVSALGVRPALLGAGTNVLAPDEGLRGLVIVTRDCLMCLERTDETHIAALAGVSMAKLAIFAQEANLTGLEFAHGIPGTVGGGVYMNAGAYGGEIMQVAEKTDFLHMDGSMQTFTGVAQGFAYRTSAFQSMQGVIVRTVFALTQGKREAIRAHMQELAEKRRASQPLRTLMEKRRASQPLELPSAGSTFKRPVGYFAGPLIEQAGLKGFQVGGAAVSEKHAGFIVNRGGATAADVLKLIEIVQKRVLENSGIALEPEIRLWKG